MKVKSDVYHLSNGKIDVEGYWVDMLKNDASYFKLANFMLNLMTIQHLNCFIERMFSQINLIKNYQKNLLDYPQ